MSLAEPEVYERLLICPRCGSALRRERVGLTCVAASVCGSASYAWLGEGQKWPALIDYAASVVESTQLRSGAADGFIQRGHGRMAGAVKRIIEVDNTTAKRYVDEMLYLMKAGNQRPLVLVIGGGSIGKGVEAIYQDAGVDVVAFDIYATPSVQLVADAHSIPLESQSVDGVIVQAVLEHVLSPWTVVKEIHRVLKPSGYVYSETPFLQNVHEGPWDFTRFTESGHRYLFRDFERLDSGWVAGLGTQLYWSLAQFSRGLLRLQAAGAVVRLLFFWLPRLDSAMDNKYTLDGASCTFFFGRRSEDRLAPNGAIRHYLGAQ